MQCHGTLHIATREQREVVFRYCPNFPLANFQGSHTKNRYKFLPFLPIQFSPLVPPRAQNNFVLLSALLLCSDVPRFGSLHKTMQRMLIPPA